MKTSEIEIGKDYAHKPYKWADGARVTVIHRTLAEIHELPEEERETILSLRRWAKENATVFVERTIAGTTAREFVSPRHLVEEWEPYAERAEMMRRHDQTHRERMTALKDAWREEQGRVEESLREHGVEGFIRFHDVYDDFSGRPEVTLTRAQVLALVDHLANR
jgi:hypothetical protein